MNMLEIENNRIITTSFKIQGQLGQKLDERVVADGYGMRGKSKWIREAIEEFLALSDYAELVSLSEEGINATCTVCVRMPAKLALDVEKTVVTIRKQYPELEGVKSRIMRTAILQRLIRK